MYMKMGQLSHYYEIIMRKDMRDIIKKIVIGDILIVRYIE